MSQIAAPRIDPYEMTQFLATTDDRIADDLVVRSRMDRTAFGDLYDMIYPPVFRYCVRRCGNRWLGEDITSTVFLSVASCIASFGGTTFQEFRRWVFTIATNEINADYRKTTRREIQFADAASSGQLGSQICEDSIDDNDRSDAMQSALMELSERAQSIITMRYFSGLSYEDIAVVMKISAGTARTAASRALEELRDKLRSNT